jgi:hypothetical protein
MVSEVVMHMKSWLEVLQALSSGVRQLVHEADHSAPHNAEAKNTWHYTSSPSIHFSGMHRSSCFR